MALSRNRKRRVPIPFIGGAYEASSLLVSAQESVNCYVEVAQESSNPAALRGVPGADVFSDLTNIRGLHLAFGQVYAVAGASVYRIDSKGNTVLLGAVVDDGDPACITSNIFEVLVVSGGNGYTIEQDDTFAQVANFPNASHCAFLDGYLLTIEKNSGRYWFTEINDASSVNGANFATAEGSPDNLVGLLVDHREVFLFGTESTERHYNDGVTPIIRAPGGFMERGCGAGYSPAKVDNTVFWLGDDFVVYRVSEGRPARVSNHGIEQLISRTNRAERAVGLAYTQDGHAFYQLTIPGELTVTYDAATNLWHTRKIYTRQDCGYTSHVYAFGKHLVGGQKLWAFGDGDAFDGRFERIRTVGPIRTGVDFASMYSLDLKFETGSSDNYLDPKKVFLEISDDGGRTFSNRIEAQIGSKAQYTQQVRFNGLGGMYDNERVMRLTLTDAARFTLVEAVAEVG